MNDMALNCRTVDQLAWRFSRMRHTTLTHVADLLIAWGAAALAKRVGTATYTFGYGRTTILAAMLNAIAILVGVVV
ncbi:MAG: cation transporter [Rhodocyclaceae bacterium]